MPVIPRVAINHYIKCVSSIPKERDTMSLFIDFFFIPIIGSWLFKVLTKIGDCFSRLVSLIFVEDS